MISLRSIPALAALNLLLLILVVAVPRTPEGTRRNQVRAAVTDGPALLHLQWVRHQPAARPAWPDQPKLHFDLAPQPVVQGGTVFVGSTRTDSLTALDLETGAERWQFRTNGPVRFAPALWDGNVFTVSDDGYLYCLDAATGQLRWKFRGGPSDRLILGNDRLISTWPARGAPAIADGIVYFAAGIWPFMGVFIHALDAHTGSVLWSNSGDGSVFIDQPHYADSFAGVAPQGRLVVSGNKLLVASGRSVPACYDRATGKQLHFRLAENGQSGGGGWDIQAASSIYLNGSGLFDRDTGARLGSVGTPALLTPTAVYSCSGGNSQSAPNAHGSSRAGAAPAAASIPATIPVPVAHVESLAADGDRLYVGGINQVAALALPLRAGQAAFAWQTPLEGNPVHIVPAEGHVLVSTRQGRLYCFGPAPAQAVVHPLATVTEPSAAQWATKARNLLESSSISDGYCVAWGAGTGPLVTELVEHSSLRCIVIEGNADRADALRADLHRRGVWADRVSVLHADPAQVVLPPYLASLMVMDDESVGRTLDPDFLRNLFATLRPYGGVACIPLTADHGQKLARLVRSEGLANAQVYDLDSWTLITRDGPLPGSADWTHEHADAANTRVSQDDLVKAPLGVLWFGGPSHIGTLPRHGHGPQPQVVDGRLIIEGPDMLRAVDIYTGRLLWEVRLPELGKEFDNTFHQPGANASGTNYISRPDGIYVVYGSGCLRLDPATGRKRTAFRLPALPGLRNPVCSGYINVLDNYLVCGVVPSGPRERGATATSKQLVVLNRHDGRLLWSAAAEQGFRHNAICLGGGRLFAIDRPLSSTLGS